METRPSVRISNHIDHPAVKRARLFYNLWAFLLACVTCGLAGCNTSSQRVPADPAQARAALRLALDTWRNGASAQALKQRQPPIQVVDHQWRTGYQLVRYQLAGDSPIGANLRCQVQLSLKNSKGKTLNKKAIYSVGTSPVITVSREEDP
jgi:hypothetical protein